ncbi:MAG TPA: tetratricopeptide repeat protein, partial [Thermoanaerobaculia bacterium]|nr:tetratricopeptide repeat protein [Thermoanaerobaculia bacterium]
DRLMREPKTGEDWYDRAYDLYRNDRYPEAAEAFVRASQLNYKKDTALYNAACSWALLGDARHATEMLAQAIDAGWDDFEHIAEDSDFDPIRRDAGFQRLVQRGGSDVATRRVTETMERYKALQEGREPELKESVADGIADSIEDAIEGAIGGRKHKAETEWFEVGLDLLRLRQFDQSIHAFQNAIKSESKSSSAMYNIACAYSLKGDARSGMQWLDKAIENGFGDSEKFENDPDIANLRDENGFEALVKKAEDLEMRGCCNSGWDDEDDRAEWAKVANHHRSMTAKYPQSGRAWFNLGFTALQARDFQTGRNAFQRAIDLGYRVGTSSYNIACGYALEGNRDGAFQWLDRAKDSGFELESYLYNDEDLKSLYDDPRFEALVKEVDAHGGWKFKWKEEKKKAKR